MSGVAPCVSCGHGADEHLLEGDGVLVSGNPTAAKVNLNVPRGIRVFRCVADGCACPDYVDEPLVRKGKR